jgi:hypothetical protein
MPILNRQLTHQQQQELLIRRRRASGAGYLQLDPEQQQQQQQQQDLQKLQCIKPRSLLQSVVASAQQQTLPRLVRRELQQPVLLQLALQQSSGCDGLQSCTNVL